MSHVCTREGGASHAVSHVCTREANAGARLPVVDGHAPPCPYLCPAAVEWTLWIFRLVRTTGWGSVRPVLRLSQCHAQISISVNGAGAAAATGLPRKQTDAISLVEERMALLDTEGLGATGWDTLYGGCAYSRSIGDRVSASAWASRAAEAARLALGQDSNEYQKYASYIGSRRKKK